MIENFEIVLAPNVELAEQVHADVSIEAEYGKICIEGKCLTLAHHGERSMNPAPCNAIVTPLEKGTILVSHLDLDTIGGVLAVTGDKIEDKDFWEGAEYIDVNGPHHIHELSQDVQDKLNAVYAWGHTKKRVRYTDLTDVKQTIIENKEMLSAILDEKHPQHEQMIEDGRLWNQQITEQVENRCVCEDSNIRVFKTDGVFCSSSYYSPKQDKVVPVTITLNEKYKSITLAFVDGGKENGGRFSAKEIVQSLWGQEAGGRDGIAGSPRGKEMSDKDLSACIKKVNEIINEKEVDTKGLKDIINNGKSLDDVIKGLTENTPKKKECLSRNSQIER